jgi:hypothetical protein
MASRELFFTTGALIYWIDNKWASWIGAGNMKERNGIKKGEC